MENIDNADIFVKPETTPEREEFYERALTQHLSPLWEVLAQLVPAFPQTSYVPALWRYAEVRPYIMEAGTLITAHAAERRVLILQNPGAPGTYQITPSLYAGLQLILPGEIAPTHRHVPSALRFIIEGEGAYTAVDGERTTMHPGDFILTPHWTWHDHGNPSDAPTVWMDGLDLPITNFFCAGFAERYKAAEIQPVIRKEGDALERYGSNMLPVEYQPANRSAPVFNYPYSKSRETLEAMYRNGPVHRCHGVKMQYINPVTGGYPMPTIAAFLQLLPKGFRGLPYRSSDSTIYCCTEGAGRTRAGEVTLTWGKRDIFAVPSWHPVSHESIDGNAVLFSFSDRAAQKALGFWREEVPMSA